MKIAWFTPFSITSAIGKYSQIATNEISKFHEVDLWIPEKTNILKTSLKKYLISFEEEKIKFLRNYDLIIYNLGDYFLFHKDIYLMSRKIKGIVILHDYVMHHFFTGYYFNYLRNNEKYIMQMYQLYGKEGEKTAKESIKGKGDPIWDSHKIIDFPFYEKAVDGSYGVIVHSQYSKKLVKTHFEGPIVVINHPIFNSQISSDKNAKKKLFIPGNKKLLLTVGNINKNKQIETVLKVLGENKEIKSQCIYAIIGSFQKKSKYVQELIDLIKKYSLEKNVRLLGYQSSDTLHRYLSASDICINLRNPVMETASWSVLEQMLYRKPIIVSNSGFYSELANDCVFKINLNNQYVDLTKTIKALLKNNTMADKYANNAYSYVKLHFTSQKYFQNINTFLTEIRSLKPEYSLIDKISNELKNMSANDFVINLDEISSIINKLFNRKN